MASKREEAEESKRKFFGKEKAERQAIAVARCGCPLSACHERAGWDFLS